jgi:hypothetical protein
LYFSVREHFVPHCAVSNITYIDLSEPNEAISKIYCIGVDCRHSEVVHYNIVWR